MVHILSPYHKAWGYQREKKTKTLAVPVDRKSKCGTGSSSQWHPSAGQLKMAPVHDLITASIKVKNLLHFSSEPDSGMSRAAFAIHGSACRSAGLALGLVHECPIISAIGSYRVGQTSWIDSAPTRRIVETDGSPRWNWLKELLCAWSWNTSLQESPATGPVSISTVSSARELPALKLPAHLHFCYIPSETAAQHQTCRVTEIKAHR